MIVPIPPPFFPFFLGWEDGAGGGQGGIGQKTTHLSLEQIVNEVAETEMQGFCYIMGQGAARIGLLPAG